MIAVDTSLFVFGGCAAVGRLNDLHRFDTTTNEWETMPSSDAILGRGGPTLGSDGDGNLYVMTGFAGQEMNDIHQFSLATKTWTQLPSDDLRPRSVCAHCSVQGKIAVFGGEVDISHRGHEGAGAFANDFLLFDPDTQSIDALDVAGAPPMARGWTSMAAFDDGKQLVLFGGLSGDDENPLRLNDLWVLRGLQ